MLVNDSKDAGCQSRTTGDSAMTISPGQLLVPIPDACSKLGNVTRTTIYGLVNQGQLCKVNIGRRGFITAGSLAALVDRLSEAAMVDEADDERGR
jgi:hypothetical protein